MAKVAAHTLGCKLNFAETSFIVNQFVEAGFSEVDFHSEADIYIINTCTVTATAEKKCRNAIRQATTLNPNAKVVVTGCFAQNDAQAIATIPGVTHIIGNDKKNRLFDIVTSSQLPSDERPQQPKQFQLVYSSRSRTRTFFKIQDGCNYFCTYCAIPSARGRSRSASVAETVATARKIAATGTKEVVLTGINTGTFGQAQGESLFSLMQQLDLIEGIERYRISSIEPNLLTEEIIQFVAQSKHFAPHFHVPLQAGHDTVLKLMHRRYTTDFYKEKIEQILSYIPNACVAADVMVGFYGETESIFNEAVAFVSSLPLSYLHVFPYSERPNTQALKYDNPIPVDERRHRSDVLQKISNQKKQQFYQKNIGTCHNVLWESDKKGDFMFGFTDNYIRVRKPYDEKSISSLQEVVLTKTDSEADVMDCNAS